MKISTTCYWMSLATLVLAFALSNSAVSSEGEPGGSQAFQDAWKLYLDDDGSAPAALEKITADGTASKIDRFNAHYVLAVIAIGDAQFDAAIKHLDAADGYLAGRSQSMVRRAEALIGQKDFKGAAEVLKKGKSNIKKNSPVFVHYQIALARIEEATDGAAKAIARLEEMAKLKPAAWESNFVLGTLYEGQDQASKALDAYAKVIENDPKKDPTAAIYAYQRWAALAISSDQGSYSKKDLVAKAKERYKVFIERAPKNNVPSELLSATQTALMVLEQFAAK